jgi:RNA polymerase sigma factor (sigma-70 family)
VTTGRLNGVLDYLHRVALKQDGPSLTDGELLGRFVARQDGSAFEELVRRHGPMVLGVCRRVLQHEADAEDAFQATFLVLLRKAASVVPRALVGNWLYGVAHKTALKAKAMKHQRRAKEREAGSRPRPEPPAETWQQLQALLDEELSRQPDKYRVPIVLCDLEGKTIREAARQLGWPQGTVAGRLARARRLLAKRLSKHGLSLSGGVVAAVLSHSYSSAAVPPSLLIATLNALSPSAAGTAAAGVSARVAALTQGVLKVMLLTKLKSITALAVSLVAAGALLLTYQGLRAKAVPADEREAAQPPAGNPGQPPAARPAQPARTDLYGDPLPEGAVMRLGTRQRRAVAAKLAVSADGKSIIAVRAARYVNVWDADTGKLRETRELPTQSRSLWVLSPEGRWLVTDDGPNGQLTVWDVRTGKAARTLTIGGAHQICPVAFGPDGNSLAALGRVGNEQSLRVWELATGKETFTNDIRTNIESYQLAFSPDGKRLLTSHWASTEGMSCWDIATGRRLWQNQEFQPSSMVITPDGKILSSMAQFPALDLATGRPIELAKRPPVTWDSRLTLTPDGRTLLLSTGEGVVVWDLAHGKALRTLVGAGEEVVVSPDGKTVVTNNGALQRWELATGKPLYADNFAYGHVGAVSALAFSADGKRLASASTDGSVRLWDVPAARPLQVWRGHPGQRPPIGLLALQLAGVSALDLSPDGRRVLSSGCEASLKLWDASAGREVRTIDLPVPQPNESGRRVFHLRFSPDGKRAVGLFGVQFYETDAGQPTPVGTYKLVTWDLETGKLLSLHPVEMAPAISSAISPDGGWLASKGALIHVASGLEVLRLQGVGRSRWQLAVVFSGDGALVAGGFAQEVKVRTKRGESTALAAAGVRIWEAATGKTVAELHTRPWDVQLAFHPNGRFIAINGADGIQVWDLVAGKVVLARRMHEKVRGGIEGGRGANDLAFSPDGRYLATGQPDGTILLWDIALPSGRSEPLAEKEIDSLWSDLGGADAAKGWRAVWRLADCPDEALPRLRQRVQPATPLPEEVTRPLLADLDDNSFQRRQQAAKRLKELGYQAEPALRKALAANPSLEQRRRIEEVLAAVGLPQPPSGEPLRHLWAVAVLERIGSPEARQALQALARGVPAARLTHEAQAAHDRMAQRAAGSP